MSRIHAIDWFSTRPAAGARTTVGAAAISLITLDLSNKIAWNDGFSDLLWNTADPTAAWEEYDNCAVELDVSITGYVIAGGSGVVSRQLQASFSRIAGAVTRIALPLQTVIGVSAALAAALTDLDSSGNLLRVRVTGVAGFTIDWMADARVRIRKVA